MECDKKGIQIQSVIYNNDKKALLRAIRAVVQSVKVYCNRIGDLTATLVYGDASPSQVFSEDDIAYVNSIFPDNMQFKYEVFGFNSGTAKGHNIMAAKATSDYLLIMNPDVVFEPSCLMRMIPLLEDKSVAMVEARQTPLEHAKEYDTVTGETDWASTACTVINRDAFNEINGFDEKTFFLYCDDLDFSWRLRLAGYKILYCPSAVVYHSKTLSVDAQWKPTGAEVYYSAEAAILLAYKWSNEKRAEELVNIFKQSSEAECKAAMEFERRKEQKELPQQIDSDHKIARFLGDEYCIMRFKIG